MQQNSTTSSQLGIPNPYYEKHPFILFPFRVVTVITVILGGIAVVVLLKDKQITRGFRKVLFFHLIVAIWMNIQGAWFIFPALQLPYVAFEPLGFLTQFGLSPLIQCEICMSTLTVNYTAIVALFYYRMEVLLPDHHFLKRPIVRHFLYFFNYVVPTVGAFIFVHFTYQNQDSTKSTLFAQYNVYFPNFFTTEVYAIILDTTNTGALIAGTCYPLGAAYEAILLIYSCWKIWIILKGDTYGMSSNTKGHHIAVMKSLSMSIACFLFVFMGNTCPLAYLLLTQSWRTDLWNICIFNGGLAIPGVIITFGLTYRPFRIVLLKMFHLNQPKTRVESIVHSYTGKRGISRSSTL